MKFKQITPVAILAVFIIIMQGCAKSDPCRTCTATYNGNSIATKKACSNADEEEFKTAHYYANVSCK